MTAETTASLADFLSARIAEDEAASVDSPEYLERSRRAHEAEAIRQAELRERYEDWEPTLKQQEQSARLRVGMAAMSERLSKVDFSAAFEGHASGWKPDRVLAECEAKRRIVERLREAEMSLELLTNPPRRAAFSFDPDEMRPRHEAAVVVLRRVVSDLAASYADHPDYREEWRPWRDSGNPLTSEC